MDDDKGPREAAGPERVDVPLDPERRQASEQMRFDSVTVYGHSGVGCITTHGREDGDDRERRQPPDQSVSKGALPQAHEAAARAMKGRRASQSADRSLGSHNKRS